MIWKFDIKTYGINFKRFLVQHKVNIALVYASYQDLQGVTWLITHNTGCNVTTFLICLRDCLCINQIEYESNFQSIDCDNIDIHSRPHRVTSWLLIFQQGIFFFAPPHASAKPVFCCAGCSSLWLFYSKFILRIIWLGFIPLKPY